MFQLVRFLNLAERLHTGTLTIVLPDGQEQTFSGERSGPSAVIRIRHPRVVRRCLTHGSIGLAESYMDGDWTTPDLAGLLELLDRNRDAWPEANRGRSWQRRLARFRHLLRSNTRRGSRRNIHAHYDLSNAFFAAWLDPSMTYSAALFPPGCDDLEAAQLTKYRQLARLIGLQPGHRLLEIGGGWGGFAVTAAKEFGARVTSITISRAQAEYARARIFREGLAERIEICLQDYRDTAGRFDRIASIEMFEAVGERFWPLFFDRLRECLAPDGQAGLQLITIADRYFEAYRRSADFIQTYIFPGGMLPSPSAIARETARAGLAIADESRFGWSYARTLAAWNRRFQTAWPTIEGRGFDERFRRLWTYYLAYCEAGFRTGSLDVEQVVLRPV